MTTLNLTVRAEVIDDRDERFVSERHVVSTPQGNPFFWADHAETDLRAIVGTVVGHLQSEYGKGKLHPHDERDALSEIISGFRLTDGGRLSVDDVIRLSARLLDQGVRPA